MNRTLQTITTVIALIVTVSIVSSACGRGSVPSSKDDPRPSIDEFRLSATQLKASLSSASDFEKPLLADGVLTFQEYEQATLAAIRCFKDAGFTIGPGDGPEVPEGTEGPRLTKRGKYTYNPISPPNYSSAQFEVVVSECHDKHTGTIDFFWAVKTAPTDQELQAARRLIGDCLREQGREVPVQPTSIELAKIAYPPDGKPQPGQAPPESYVACARAVTEEFDLPGFLG